MEKVKNLVVGCGLSGATIARQIAEICKEEVTIIDKRSSIAGNCYDYIDENNICIHKYGTHIFHTNLEEVWKFLSRFTKWHPYFHQVVAQIDGKEVPIPFNFNSIEMIFPSEMAKKFETKLINRYGFNIKVPILELKKEGDKDLEFLAQYVYEKVFLNYTLKQWGLSPEELDPTVTGRVPIYISKDNRYFQDKYQGIPMEGYTRLVEKMLDHPYIHVHLSQDYHKIKNDIEFDKLFFTGCIDEFYDFEFGELPYRSLDFDFRTYPYPYFQKSAVVNYPNNFDFTRIGEYKYFLNNKSDRTVVSYEYPAPYIRGKNDPYYPIIKKENQIIYQSYLKKAAQDPRDIYFLGRLGDYKYYDMDKAINRALLLFKEVKEKW